ncbi:MAG TPA: YvcK family protein [Limnochordales bacterium]
MRATPGAAQPSPPRQSLASATWRGRAGRQLPALVRSLLPGTGLKRWGLLALAGVMAGAVGGGLWAQGYASWGLGAVGAGLAASVVAVRRAVAAVAGTLAPHPTRPLLDVMRERRIRERGPRAVALGGGTGLSTLLRGMKFHSDHLTAVVTVADDGGSSGRLREEMGILPPGDVRNTLVAMADTEPLLERLFQYRFTRGEGLSGHTFGNLFIAAMSEITGDFQEAIRQFSRVLAVRGQVLPSTLQSVQLRAEFADGTSVTGESAIPRQRKPIRRIALVPPDARAVPEALEAILSADIVVLGPGSLYTSVIPNLLVQDVAAAVRATPALRVYVCNVMTQPGETDGYAASDHVRALLEHGGGPGLIDCVLVNTAQVPEALLQRYMAEGARPVEADIEKLLAMGLVVVSGPLVSLTHVVRHDAVRLAEAVTALAALGRDLGPPGTHLSLDQVLARAQHPRRSPARRRHGAAL